MGDSMRVHPIDTLQAPASAAFFQSYFERRPVVLSNAISDWPATRSWTPEYLTRRYGDVVVAVARYDPHSGGSFLEQTLADLHERVPLREFLSGLEEGNHLYALREDTTLFERAPQLLEDVANFSPFSSFPRANAYKSLWIGPQNYVTGLHVDPGDTLLFQLYGRKRVLLFHPDQTPYLYQERFMASAQKFADSALRQRLEPSMLDVLRDKVRWCAVQPFSPDLCRFPLFAHATCVEVEIGPGDTLYIPDRWWHAVESMGATISISIEPDFRESNFAQTDQEQLSRL
jgi:lysine-specific demethylase 8